MQRFPGIIAILMLTLAISEHVGAGETSAAPQFTADDEALSDTDFAWDEFIQPPMPDDDPRIRARFAAYTDALATKAYPEAEIVAKQMAEHAVGAGIGSPQRSRALHNLAVAQQVMGNYDAALQNYVASVDLIADYDNNLSPDLVLPLRGFAAALNASGRPYDAYAALERALHISHVNFGPHSLYQLPILRSKLDQFLAEGDRNAGLEVLDAIFILYKRLYERDSSEMLPALYERAEIFRRLRMYWEERMAWEHILDIKQANLPAYDLGLIEPNVRLAHLLMRGMRRDAFRSVTASDAEKHLKRALRIARNSPDRNWETTTECLLSLADFYTIFDMKGRARRYYGDAWQLLSSSKAYRAARDEKFAVPVPLARPESGAFVGTAFRADEDSSANGGVRDGELTVEFTVDDRGRTRDVRLLSADTQNIPEIEERAVRAVEAFIYRPRYVDGHPVSTQDQQFRFRFQYRDSDQEPSTDGTGTPGEPR